MVGVRVRCCRQRAPSPARAAKQAAGNDLQDADAPWSYLLFREGGARARAHVFTSDV